MDKLAELSKKYAGNILDIFMNIESNAAQLVDFTQTLTRQAGNFKFSTDDIPVLENMNKQLEKMAKDLQTIIMSAKKP